MDEMNFRSDLKSECINQHMTDLLVRCPTKSKFLTLHLYSSSKIQFNLSS